MTIPVPLNGSVGELNGNGKTGFVCLLLEIWEKANAFVRILLKLWIQISQILTHGFFSGDGGH